MRGSILRRAGVLATLAALLGAAAPVSAYEEPKYSVERAYDGFELRQYAPQLVVETTVRGDFDAARNAAFRRLFRYISGANRPGEKIAMTVPVTSARGEKIAMTVPVTSRDDAVGTVMRFVVPSRFTADTVPQPTDPTVTVRALPARTVAARRYSGRATRENYERELADLRNRLAATGFVPVGEPVFAVYNGPFTPWFMRRNEVLVEVRPPAK